MAACVVAARLLLHPTARNPHSAPRTLHSSPSVPCGGIHVRVRTRRWVLHLLSAAFWAGKEGRDGEVTLEEEDADAEEEARDPHWEVSTYR